MAPISKKKNSSIPQNFSHVEDFLPSDLRAIANLMTFEKYAQKIIPPDVFDFIQGGSSDERTLKRNRHVLENMCILPRVLRGLSEITTGTTLLNENITAPIILAPTAYQKLVFPEGELATLRAANAFNTIFIVPMFSTTDYGILAENARVPLWLQMYFVKDRAANIRLLERAKNLGYKAIVVTVDAPIYGKREREMARPLIFPKNMSFDHLQNLGIPFDIFSRKTTHFAELVDPTIGWKDIAWLAEVSDLPIILKGILDPRDTEIARTFPHVKGVIVSNHGGRQLDGTPSAFELVEAHRKVAGRNFMVMVDGGITRGQDVFAARALGADAACIGRSALWGLAVGGSEGVERILRILHEELIQTMTLSGCTTLTETLSGCTTLTEITGDFVSGMRRDKFLLNNYFP